MSTTIELPFLWVLSSRRTLANLLPSAWPSAVQNGGEDGAGGKALVRAVGASKPFPEPTTREIERVDRVCPALIAVTIRFRS